MHTRCEGTYRNMICIKGMSETKGIGKYSRRDQFSRPSQPPNLHIGWTRLRDDKDMKRTDDSAGLG
jgi:hypothetical protein